MHVPAPRRPSLAIAILLLGLLVLAVLPNLAGSAPAADLPPAPEGFALDGDLEQGKEIFLDKCAICHGDQGAGDGKLSGSIEPPPGNLQERVDAMSEWEIYKVIQMGGTITGKSPVMVGFGRQLDEQQLMDVATYTLSLGELDEE